MKSRSETPGNGPRFRDQAARLPITIEVIAYAPVAFFHCMHCELIWQESAVRTNDRRDQLETALPEDLQEQYQAGSDWVHRMREAHGPRLRFRIIDAVSVEGWIKIVALRCAAVSRGDRGRRSTACRHPVRARERAH